MSPGTSSPVRTSPSPSPAVLTQTDLAVPDGAVDLPTADLLGQLVHHQPEDTPVDVGGDDDQIYRSLPWWKRPSPWWLLVIVPITAASMSATIAPRIEVYTNLACSVHKPDVYNETFRDLAWDFPAWDFTSLSLSLPPNSLSLTYSTGPRDAPSLSGTNENEHANAVAAWRDESLFADHSYATTEAVNSTTPRKKRPNLCASDPVVQAAVAKLAAVSTACMGFLSCITTGWWGSFSDRQGRTKLMGISVLGAILTDFNFIFVSQFHHYLPGNYWFLLLGPLVEGLFGGLTSAIAAIHAYMADTSTEATRSRLYSLSSGLLFAGMAIGPTLGSLLIRYTQSTLSVFWVAGVTQILYAIMAWFIIPESLSKDKMVQFRAQYAQQLAETAQHRERNPAAGLLVRVKKLFTFLSPLSVFLPDLNQRQAGSPMSLKRIRRDWALALLVISYGFTLTVIGSYTYKYQYAASTFGWTSETIGYWISLIGATRAVFLTVVLPVVIRIFQSGSLPKPSTTRTSSPSSSLDNNNATNANNNNSNSSETEPLLSRSRSRAYYDTTSTNATINGNNNDNEERPPITPAAGASTPSTSSPKTEVKAKHSLAFDLGLARVSLIIELISYGLMGLAPNAMAFTVCGILGAFGAGFAPAMQSITLAMYMRRGGEEAGKLFGAMSVIQALRWVLSAHAFWLYLVLLLKVWGGCSSQILGPAMYALVYMRTVATFPRTIFFVSVLSVAVSFVLLAFIRLPPEGAETEVETDDEETCVGARGDGA
ncbi:hypothetical protein AX16_008911 [Volvariella volvacea WC 439]|nr:hypothetical protein AX16_008911 [Volvariella volvacea WC 439]